MLGRPASWEPVCTNVIAGSWLIASVCIDCTMHHRSAVVAIRGNNSLNQAPDCPCCANRNSDGITCSRRSAVIDVSRWPLRIDSGSSSPRRRARAGLASNRSSWEGPPDMVSEITRFALGWKWGRPMTAASSAAAPPASRAPAAASPIPWAAPERNRRRLRRSWRAMAERPFMGRASELRGDR